MNIKQTRWKNQNQNGDEDSEVINDRSEWKIKKTNPRFLFLLWCWKQIDIEANSILKNNVLVANQQSDQNGSTIPGISLISLFTVYFQ